MYYYLLYGMSPFITPFVVTYICILGRQPYVA